ncbi:hypothetical protein [Prauserella halophila]|uniref:hypothetical protein n=1 Tax=Prauserella halophila TaxID=185641 RepID=UPI0020A47BA3|nr:hypothetical protein [Prauserella halophila]MCP2234236.1 hypothetical protein [Prauserella halophila]
MAKKNEKVQVEMVTRNGERQRREVSEDEARRLEQEPFREDSNVSIVSVSPTR